MYKKYFKYIYYYLHNILHLTICNLYIRLSSSCVHVLVNVNTSSSHRPLLGLKAPVNDLWWIQQISHCTYFTQICLPKYLPWAGKRAKSSTQTALMCLSVISGQFCLWKKNTKEKELQDSPQGDNNWMRWDHRRGCFLFLLALNDKKELTKAEQPKV